MTLGVGMSYEEKNAWAFLAITIVSYVTYAWIVLSQTSDIPLYQVAYQPILLWTIGCAIGAGIIAGIAVAVGSPRSRERVDQRDKQIAAFGGRVGHTFLIAGGVTALLLALIRADQFWIANTLYLAFVLSAIFNSAAKLVAYRRGLPQW